MKRPPKDLAPAGRAFWRSVLETYELSPAELVILGRAARTADRLARLDDLIAKTSPLVVGSVNQVRASPLWGQITEQERLLAHLVRTLDLPDGGEQVTEGQQEWRNRRRRGCLA